MSIVWSAHIHRSPRRSVSDHDAEPDNGLWLPDGRQGTVILVHGLTGTPNEMRFVANFLHQAGYAVVCPRLANHGQPLEVLKDTTWEECYRSVRDALLRLKAAGAPRPIFAAGLSMGALLALMLAAEFPEEIAGVSCLSPTLFYDGWNMPGLYHRVLTPLFCLLTPLLRFFYFKEEPPYGIKNHAVRHRIHTYYSQAVLHDAGTDNVAKYGYPYMPFSLLYQLHRAVKHLKPRLSSITTPVQLIQAEDDDMTSPKNSQFIYDRIGSPVKELVRLYDSYHVITADQERETVARKLREFFDRLRPPATTNGFHSWGATNGWHRPVAPTGRPAPHSTNSHRPPADRPARPLTLSHCAVFFDFDNTITRSDVLDDILERFSIDRAWCDLERDWQAGRIGSKECLEAQVQSVRVTPQALSAYLSTVPIDPAFGRLVALFRAEGVEPVIVSDSFSLFIGEILKRHRLDGLPVYANTLQILNDRLLPSFPYVNGCSRCAHCKKNHLLPERSAGKTVIYVGDGLSDVCPAQYADLLFAKGSLADHCRAHGIPHVAFQDLADIEDYLTRCATP